MNKKQGGQSVITVLPKPFLHRCETKASLLSALKKECVERLKPMVGELEVNSIAEEKNYVG